MAGRILYFVIFGGLMFLGIGIMLVYAIPYIQNRSHEIITDTNSYLCQQVPTWFTLELKTEDIFSANNPINATIQTGAIHPDIIGMQLSFVGAQSEIPEMPTMPSLPELAPTDPNYRENMDNFWEEMGEYWKEIEEWRQKYRASLESNILLLERDRTVFKGNIKDLIYRSGGQFDIGITITTNGGTVIGYGMGDTSYVLQDVINVSPPEVLLQIRQTNVTLGLAWAALGASFFAIGCTAIIELVIKHYI